jgi:hypothetical protein
MTAKILHRAAAAGLLLLATSCGGGSTPTTPTPPPPPPAAVNSGALNVTISGVPSGTNASVTVTGPNSYSRVLTATTAITALAAGAYTATAANVTGGDGTVYAAPAAQTATVANGTTAAITATYTAQPIVPEPQGQDLAIAGLYITQGTQRLDGSIPLVTNRDAWLRVFVRAGNFSTPSAPVRVRLYQAGTLVQTITIPSPSAFVPTNVDEGSPGTSWNIPIPGSRIQPGLSILADVDPANAVTETSEANNNFPSTGTPLPLAIRTVQTMNIRLVPVQTRSGLGNVTTDNAASFLTFTRAIWPVAAIASEVRSIFTASDTAVFQDGGSWSRVLGELRALRTAESSEAYYVGVVSVTYNSGIAGIGYVPTSPEGSSGFRAVLTWDRVNSRASVTAHELGHNFGRPHAPCGNTDRPDPQYPYADGSIGIFGVDVPLANSSPSGLSATGVIKPPTFTDLMGYCNNEWVSDFHYLRVLDWRTSGVTAVRMATEPLQPVLIVWGRSSDAGITLEPAFAVTARPARPSGTGTHLVEVRDEAGTVTYSARFTPDAVDHAGPSETHFNFALPMSVTAAARVGSIRVSTIGRQAELRRTAGAITADARIATGADARSAVALRTVTGLRGTREARWDAEAYPFAVIRDARSGQITGFSRNGAAALAGAETELTLSDGVRSRVVRVTP